MKTLILIIIPCLIFSQPIKQADTAGMATGIKNEVEKIVANTKHSEKNDLKINAELQKQIELMRQIKVKIAQLKFAPKVKQSNTKQIIIDSMVNLQGLKQEDLVIEINGQFVQWEQRPKKWFGRLFSKHDILLYPYILDTNGNKIYLK